MEVALIIATFIGGAVGVVQLVKWVKKPKPTVTKGSPSIVRPFIDVEVSYQGGSSGRIGRSPRAVPNPGQNYFIADETLNIWELKRKIMISLVNNSDVAALYPKLRVHTESFQPKLGRLNEVQPIKAHESVQIECSYEETEEKIPRERTKLDHFPSAEQKNDLRILVEYQSSNRITYYTLFTGQDKKNEYLEVLPDGFDDATNR